MDMAHLCSYNNSYYIYNVCLSPDKVCLFRDPIYMYKYWI